MAGRHKHKTTERYKKMKKILMAAIVAASVAVLTGCQKEEEKPGADAISALKSSADNAAKAANAGAQEAKKTANDAAQSVKKAVDEAKKPAK